MRTYHSDHFLNLTATLLIGLVLITGHIYGTGSKNNSGISEVEASSAQNVSGFAWSDNIGWISFNCKDSSGASSMDTCATSDYGVNIASDGYFSGLAWSDNIGWINFGQLPSELPDTTGCTSGDCRAYVDLSAPGNPVVTGWARACTVFVTGCSGALKDPSVLGGWDGWIKMSDAAWTNDVYLDRADSHLKGFAWGSDVVGWIDFNPLAAGVLATLGPPDVTLNVDPSTPLPVPYGANAKINWTVTGGATSCNANSVPAINWFGAKSTTGGTQNDVGPMTIDTLISIDCSNSEGSDNDSVNLTVSAFVISVSPAVKAIDLSKINDHTQEITINASPTLGSTFNSPITLSAVTHSGTITGPAVGTVEFLSGNTITPNGPAVTATFTIPIISPNGPYFVVITGDGGSGFIDSKNSRFNITGNTPNPPTVKEI